MSDLMRIAIGAIIVAILGYYFGVKSRRKELALEYQAEQYTNLITHIRRGFLEEREDSKEYQEMALAESNKFWLLASDEVIWAMNETFDKLDDNEASADERNNSFKEMVLTMRKDLYGKKTSIKADDIKLLKVGK